MPDTILVQRDDALATVILNRPEKLNALNKAMWRRLGEVVRDLSNDTTVRCVILRGAGEKAFGPGADIKEFSTVRANVEQARAYGMVVNFAMRVIGDCPLPTLAMIKGICVGGALEVASMCDLRICGASSRFGVPIQRLGLVMAYQEIRGLVELVGRSVALEILLEGRVFDAREAKEKGLVNRIVDDERVEEEVYTTARRIAAGAPLVHRWHKKFIRRLADPAPLSDAELDEGYACFGTEDFQIGLKAFLEKVPPEFTGR